MLLVVLTAVIVGFIVFVVCLLSRRYKHVRPGRLEQNVWRVGAILSLCWPAYIFISGIYVMEHGFVLFDFAPVYGWRALMDYVGVMFVFNFVFTAVCVVMLVISVSALILIRKYEMKEENLQ